MHPTPNQFLDKHLFQTDLFHPQFMIHTMTDFDIINFLFWMVTFPRFIIEGVYISQFTGFSRVA